MHKAWKISSTLGLCVFLCLNNTKTHAAAPPLLIGLYPSYPPLDMRDPQTNALEGFDVDLGRALIQHMPRSASVVETSFAQLIPSLLSGRIDLFFNGMMDTPTRRESIAFVDYLQAGFQFITLAGEASAPHTLPELCGKMVAASRLTSEPAHLLAWSAEHCVQQHLPPVELFATENSADARLQLREGRVVAVLQDSLTTPWLLQVNNGVFEQLGEPFGLTPLGIGLSKGNSLLNCQITAALAELQANGTYLALIHKWHLPQSSALPPMPQHAGCYDHAP
ncbi:MAG: transporter substrate-binding domain-containing protein [Acetobacter sp.]